MEIARFWGKLLDCIAAQDLHSFQILLEYNKDSSFQLLWWVYSDIWNKEFAEASTGKNLRKTTCLSTCVNF